MASHGLYARANGDAARCQQATSILGRLPFSVWVRLRLLSWRDGNGAYHPGISAFDIKSADPDMCGRIEERCARYGVVNCASPEPALRGADLVVSLVTADQALVAATAAAPYLSPGALYVDGNSCAPATKREAARHIDGAGGRYVDMAIMAPVYPKRHRTPILLAGPHAAAARRALELSRHAARSGGRRGRPSRRSRWCARSWSRASRR